MSVAGKLVDRIGARLHATRSDTADVPVSPGVVRDGEFLAAALMLAADIASGIRHHEPDVAMVLTNSFSLRRAAKLPLSAVTATAEPLFNDGRRAVDRVTFRSDSAAIVASAHISFVIRRLEEATTVPLAERLVPFRAPRTQPIEEPLIEAVGIRVLDAPAGRVAMNVGDDVRRKAGMLQGSIVTLLGEASALAMAEHHFQSPAIVDALDVDFLEPVHTSAVITDARWLAEPGSGDVEVVLRTETTGPPLAVFVIGVVRANSR